MKNQNKDCWWCKSKADSREHIFKKSDLKRTFRKSVNSKKSYQIIDNGLKQHRAQGPNSKFVKWEANLCSSCNNSRSSSFDKSYDEFIENMQPYFIQIMKDKYIDLSLVFGNEWKVKFSNLLKYYVKHISCRLSHHILDVPKNIIDFLNGDDSLRDIIFNFEVRPMNKIAAETSNEMFNDSFEVLRVGLFNAAEKEENGKQSAFSFFSWLSTGWISVNYVIQNDFSPNGFNHLENSIFPLNIGPIVLPEEFEYLPNIAEKISFLDEYERRGNNQNLQKYYSRII
jgi:hypothetical protein